MMPIERLETSVQVTGACGSIVCRRTGVDVKARR